VRADLASVFGSGQRFDTSRSTRPASVVERLPWADGVVNTVSAGYRKFDNLDIDLSVAGRVLDGYWRERIRIGFYHGWWLNPSCTSPIAVQEWKHGFDMPTKCSECGVELPANGQEGLCPKCLLKLGLGEELEHTQASPKEGDNRQRPDEPAVSPPLTEGPGTIIGRYKLLEKIGEGGFGAVYVAEQTEPVKRRVALKIIKLGMDTRQVVARFEAERQALALMDHPHIAKVLDGGATETGRPYFVMELMRGVPITSYCDDHNLNTADRLALFIQVCHAIQHAHQKGIIHRDIKPSNILITRQDGVAMAKVIDFGIAKATQQELTEKTIYTQLQQFIGTPAYMSPEQVEMTGGDIDTRSDIYALGVLLYELLVGKPPFDAMELLRSGLDALRRTICETEPVRPSTRLSTMPNGELTTAAQHRSADAPTLIHGLRGDLDWIVMKALEKDRARRYETASGLAMDVRRYLDSEPVLARPPSRTYRFEKLVRRNKVVFALGGTAAATLIAGLGVSTTLFLKESKAHQRAVTAEGIAEKARQAAEESVEQERRSRYEFDMNLALAALSEGNRSQAFELVCRHKPKKGEADLRGFEWRHLWSRCRGDYELALPVHNQVVGGISFSPDRTLLATWCWDNTLRIWAWQSRTSLLAVTNATALGGFSADSAEFIAGRQDGSISAYRPRTGQERILVSTAGELVAVAANGKVAVTIDRENRLRVWDLQTQQLKWLLPEPVRRRLDFNWGAGVAIAPQGDWLAVVDQSPMPGRADKGIKLWNIAEETHLVELSESRQIRCLSFSPDGKILAVGDGGGSNNDSGPSEGGSSIWLWDMATYQAQTTAVGALPVLSLAFSANGETLATGSSDQTIKLWDVPTLTPQESYRSVGAVWALALSPDGQHLASGSRDQAVEILKLKGDERQAIASNLDSREWGNFCFSADSKLMAAGCKDNKVRVWDVQTWELQRELPGASYTAGFAQDGRLLTSSKDESPKWWDLKTQTATTIRAYPERLEGSVPCVDLSPDRRTAALGFKSGAIQLLDIETERVTATFKSAHPGGVDCLAFFPLGDKLISGGRDRTVALWTVPAQQGLDRFDMLFRNQEHQGHKGSVCAVAVSANGKLLATGCSAGTLKFWDPADHLRKSEKTLAYHKSVIRTLCFSPDTMTLASGSEDDTVKLWNTKTFQIVASFRFDDHIRLVLFSPDGNNLAVVTDHGSLHLLRATPKDQADAELAALAK
jgi:WD40 repeat protein/serine/threonine protein kinase